MGPAVQQPYREVPAGFEATASGLVVPAGSRQPETERWAWDDAKHIVRAVAVANRHGLTLLVGCGDRRCVEHPLVSQKPLPNGGFTWECGHLVRIITDGPQPERRRFRR